METNTQKTGFFDEAPNVKSNMRLMSFLLLLFFIAYHLPFGMANAKAVQAGTAVATMSDNQLWFDLIVLVFVFIPKAAQKIIELKFSNK